MMLIPDLLNILFDQANYETLTTLKCLNKRKTKYADKYSVLSYYGAKNVNFDDVCEKGLIKMCVHIVPCRIGQYGRISIYRALWLSAKNGNILVIKHLVSIGVNIHANDETALFQSAGNGHLEVVKYLVNIGANIHVICDCEHLMKVGPNLHSINESALAWSARGGHLDVVKYLVGIGANIHADDDFALLWSAYSGHLEVVKYLVSVGANIHVNNNELFGIEMIKNNFGYLQTT